MKATHQIVQVHFSDSYYENNNKLKGKKGFFTKKVTWSEGNYAGIFKFSKSIDLFNTKAKTSIVTFHSVNIKTL